MTQLSFLSGFGAYVPESILSNGEIASRENIETDWIVSRTGIEARHIAAPDQTGTDMAKVASERAMEQAGFQPEDITHIIYATCTPDAASPSAACTLSDKLNAGGVMAVDVNAACAGFLNGIELARGLVAMNPSACVLLVASERLSHKCNWKDHSTAVLFGDGAGAVLVTGQAPAARNRRPVGKVIDNILATDGKRGKLLLITGGYSVSPYKMGDIVGPDYFIRMDGGLVYKHAVRNMTAYCTTILERNNMTPDDIDMFVPHQANLRIIEAVGARLGIGGDRCFVNVQKYGNTSAASIPIALDEAIEAGAIKAGMKVLMTSFGGGLTFGATLLNFE